MNDREKFYYSVITKIIKDKNATVLICCGGELDKNTFKLAGFNNVTISNLDDRIVGSEFLPYNYKYEDIISLSFNNDSFDYTVVHDGIHHTSLPHKSITEMYRVAKKGVVCIESRDSLLIRIFSKFGLIQEYEHSAVYYNDCQYGGVNNTEIPNYVYRWTERDVEKTINSFAPHAKNNFNYEYGSAYPQITEKENNNRFKLLFLKLIQPLYWVLIKIFRKQQNLFAFYIEKPVITDSLHPWLEIDEKQNIIFNKNWGNHKYRSEEN